VEERWVDTSVYNDDDAANSKVVVTKRHLSQAMIPGKHLVKVEISQSLYDKHVVPVVSTDE